MKDFDGGKVRDGSVKRIEVDIKISEKSRRMMFDGLHT